MNRRIKLLDIALALRVSTGTVHRALHDHPGVSPMTRSRVLRMAKTLGYRPNLAARYLSTKRNLRISVNTLQGTASFWHEVRAGIAEEARSLVMENVEIEYRTYPLLGEGEEEAFEAALKSTGSSLSPAGRRNCAPGCAEPHAAAFLWCVWPPMLPTRGAWQWSRSTRAPAGRWPPI